MKNRFHEYLNLAIPHPDLTDALFDSTSEQELMFQVLKALPDLTVESIASYFSGTGLSVLGAVEVLQQVLEAHDSLLDIVWQQSVTPNKEA